MQDFFRILHDFRQDVSQIYPSPFNEYNYEFCINIQILKEESVHKMDEIKKIFFEYQQNKITKYERINFERKM